MERMSRDDLPDAKDAVKVRTEEEKNHLKEKKKYKQTSELYAGLITYFNTVKI